MTAIVEPLPAADIARERLKARRWIQLVIGVICMVMIANLQYGWTLFVPSIQKAYPAWNLKEIQWAFTAFVAAETLATSVALGPVGSARFAGQVGDGESVGVCVLRA